MLELDLVTSAVVAGPPQLWPPLLKLGRDGSGAEIVDQEAGMP